MSEFGAAQSVNHLSCRAAVCGQLRSATLRPYYHQTQYESIHSMYPEEVPQRCQEPIDLPSEALPAALRREKTPPDPDPNAAAFNLLVRKATESDIEPNPEPPPGGKETNHKGLPSGNTPQSVPTSSPSAPTNARHFQHSSSSRKKGKVRSSKVKESKVKESNVNESTHMRRRDIRQDILFMLGKESTRRRDGELVDRDDIGDKVDGNARQDILAMLGKSKRAELEKLPEWDEWDKLSDEMDCYERPGNPAMPDRENSTGMTLSLSQYVNDEANFDASQELSDMARLSKEFDMHRPKKHTEKNAKADIMAMLGKENIANMTSLPGGLVSHDGVSLHGVASNGERKPPGRWERSSHDVANMTRLPGGLVSHDGVSLHGVASVREDVQLENTRTEAGESRTILEEAADFLDCIINDEAAEGADPERESKATLQGSGHQYGREWLQWAPGTWHGGDDAGKKKNKKGKGKGGQRKQYDPLDEDAPEWIGANGILEEIENILKLEADEEVDEKEGKSKTSPKSSSSNSKQSQDAEDDDLWDEVCAEEEESKTILNGSSNSLQGTPRVLEGMDSISNVEADERLDAKEGETKTILKGSSSDSSLWAPGILEGTESTINVEADERLDAEEGESKSTLKGSSSKSSLREEGILDGVENALNVELHEEALWEEGILDGVENALNVEVHEEVGAKNGENRIILNGRSSRLSQWAPGILKGVENINVESIKGADEYENEQQVCPGLTLPATPTPAPGPSSVLTLPTTPGPALGPADTTHSSEITPPKPSNTYLKIGAEEIAKQLLEELPPNEMRAEAPEFVPGHDDLPSSETKGASTGKGSNELRKEAPEFVPQAWSRPRHRMIIITKTPCHMHRSFDGGCRLCRLTSATSGAR